MRDLSRHLGRVRHYQSMADVSFSAGDVYLYGVSDEARSGGANIAKERCPALELVTVRDIGDNVISLELPASSLSLAVRDDHALIEAVSMLGGRRLVLDVTGLAHHVWAPLLKALVLSRVQSSVIYVEPNQYRFKAGPSETNMFGLSEQFTSLRFLPGFEAVSTPDAPFAFVALLGFEGSRFSYALTQLAPQRKDVYPVIGVPGFQPEYPSYTLLCNYDSLSREGSWNAIHYARANCPVSAFELLRDIELDTPTNAVMRIAPLGTKPHAVGAVLYYLWTSRESELLYDFPQRSSGRSVGLGRVTVLDISDFLGAVERATG